MKQLIIAALLATAALANTDYEAMFRQFKATHLKAYVNEAEETKRFKAFVENMKKAEVLQAANPHATFGASVYADLTEAEFKTYHNGDNHFKASVDVPLDEVKYSPEELHAAAGQKIDWRTEGAVTAVKDQSQCGAGWAFSVTGNIEGQWFLAGNKLTALSEQELISCNTLANRCYTSNRYTIQDAFKWLLQKRDGSIVTEVSLPYKSESGYPPGCPSNLATLPVGAIITDQKVVGYNEYIMADYCYTNGPISVVVDATTWQTYTGGILTNCVSQVADHGVLIVGFDNINFPPYWIIKNSWGAAWGEAGYIRVAKGSNQCGITTLPISSIVGGPTTTIAPRRSTTTTNTSELPPPSITTSPRPTTTRAPRYGNWTQKFCDNDYCTQGCQSQSWPLNACVNMGSYHMVAICGGTILTMTQYATADCTGTGYSEKVPANKCLQDGSKYRGYYC